MHPSSGEADTGAGNEAAGRAKGAQARETFRRQVQASGGAAATARTLGCSRAYVDMILAGSRRPGMRVAHAIERALGIPMQAWLAESGGDSPAKASGEPGSKAT